MSTPRQLAFELPHRVARGRGDYFVSSANATALAAIEGWQDWPGRKLVLVGPPGSGKSHLAAVWAELSGAQVLGAGELAGIDPGAFAVPALAIEDAEALAGQPEAERAAFHAHNLVLEGGGHLLVTASAPPSRWGLGLPDLASRMQGSSLVSLGAPDEALMAMVLVKLFADRQLAAPPSLIDWLLPRLERSLEAARQAVEALDAAALGEGRSLSRELARRVLDNGGEAGA